MTTTSIDPRNTLAEVLNFGLLTESFQASGWVGNRDELDIYKISIHQVEDLNFSAFNSLKILLSVILYINN